DGCEVRITSDLEGDEDLGEPTVGARRGHVAHALDAVDDGFQRGRHRTFNCLCVRTGVKGADGDRRWCELWIPADGQRGNRDRPGQSNKDGADRREDRPSYKDVCNHLGRLRLASEDEVEGGLRLRAWRGRTRRANGRAVANLLNAGHDQLFSRLQST